MEIEEFRLGPDHGLMQAGVTGFDGVDHGAGSIED
jgi:hypothetical protein